MTVRTMPLERVMCGDEIIVNNQSGKVKYIDGPDTHGTYDVHFIDKSGKEHIEIVTGVVTINL